MPSACGLPEHAADADELYHTHVDSPAGRQPVERRRQAGVATASREPSTTSTGSPSDVGEQARPGVGRVQLERDVAVVGPGVASIRSVAAVGRRRAPRHTGGVVAVEADRDAQQPGEDAHRAAGRRRPRAANSGCLRLGRRLAVVAGDLGDELDLAVGEAGELLAVRGSRSSCACGARRGTRTGRRWQSSAAASSTSRLSSPSPWRSAVASNSSSASRATCAECGGSSSISSARSHDARAAQVGQVVQRAAVLATPRVEQHALPQGVVGERELGSVELVHDLLEDQRPGEDDVGPARVEARASWPVRWTVDGLGEAPDDAGHVVARRR